MNILMYHRNLPPDSYTGVALQVHFLADSLCELGNQVTVMTFSTQSINPQYKIQTITLPKWLMYFPLVFKLAKRIITPILVKKNIDLLSSNFEIIHIHGDGGFLQYGKNWVRSFYGSALREMQYSRNIKGRAAQYISHYFEKKENKQLSKMGKSVGISRDTQDCLDSISKIIPCMLGKAYTLQRNREKSKKPSLLLVGSIGGRKKAEMGMEIYSNLCSLGIDIKFTIVCKNKKLHQQYWEKHFDSQYSPVFMEDLEEEKLLDAYEKNWFFLNLASYEGFGVGVIEAMSQGCIVISTKNAGALDIIESGTNGYLAEPNDFSNLLLFLINDEEKRKEVREKAIFSSQKYFPETVAKSYLDIYRD